MPGTKKEQKEMRQFVGFDLGASNGRGMLGTIADGRIELTELNRFETHETFLLGRRQWDFAALYRELLEGLRVCARDHTARPAGIAIDTWGVDFGLVAADGTILSNPVHYRDHRTDGMIELAEERLGRAEIFGRTGIATHFFNTLYQVLSLVQSKSPLLEVAQSLHLMPDLLAYSLCGVRALEYTNASTTQLLDPWTKSWRTDLMEELKIPRRLFPEPTAPGTILGTLLDDVAKRTGMDGATPVIATATHDTASAVAAVPATEEGGDWAYLSSGTWSLLGVELDKPKADEEALEAGFTNEGGVNNKIRFLQNIVGLWLIQECRRIWAEQGDVYSYAELTDLASRAEPFVTIIPADDERLLAPDNMVETVKEICRERSQPIPESPGAMIRCLLESLALCYRKSLANLDRMLGRKTVRLHIIGGGTQNELLNQMAADSCGIPVIAGPVEATALGNIVVQAMGTGLFPTHAGARAAIAASFPVKRYEPRDSEAWDRVAGRC